MKVYSHLQFNIHNYHDINIKNKKIKFYLKIKND
jgi:hypothetical protein